MDKMIKRGIGANICSHPKCPNKDRREKIVAVKSLGPIIFKNGKSYHLSCSTGRPLTGADLTK
jgi:hypothetical protein